MLTKKAEKQQQQKKKRIQNEQIKRERKVRER